MSHGRTVALAAATAVGVIVADQIAKAVVRAQVGRGEAIHLLPGVQLVNVRNSGVAFGLFAEGGALLAVIAAVVLAGVLAFFLRNLDRRLVWLPTGLLIAGALGNLLDRAREGAVTDFIDVRWWPAFNVADMAITFGVVGLLWVLEGPGRKRA
ncbi:MAG: signal peptidase [Solirubrobacteraceae bacterium]|nr:signal peptidase [Solirubrobacteraceae bacterium]